MYGFQHDAKILLQVDEYQNLEKKNISECVLNRLLAITFVISVFASTWLDNS